MEEDEIISVVSLEDYMDLVAVIEVALIKKQLDPGCQCCAKNEPLFKSLNDAIEEIRESRH
jgi:hypothetical protein